MTYNPSLRIISRSQTADVLPTQKEPSILTWLEGTGRLKPREDVAAVDDDREEESEEIDDLMGDSSKAFDDDDDDDLSLGDDD
ncbi:MAG: DUF3134 family protein [Cyanobacteria bacterium P01_D01_bin.71]